MHICYTRTRSILSAIRVIGSLYVLRMIPHINMSRTPMLYAVLLLVMVPYFLLIVFASLTCSGIYHCKMARIL